MKTKYLLSALAMGAMFAACSEEEIVVNGASDFNGNEIVGAKLLGTGLSMNISTNDEGEGTATRATGLGWEDGDVAGLAWVTSTDPSASQSGVALGDVTSTLYANHFYQYVATGEDKGWSTKSNIYEGWHFAYFPYAHHKKPSELSFVINDKAFTSEDAKDWKGDIVNNSPHLSAAAKLTEDNVNTSKGSINQGFAVERIVNVLLPNLEISKEFTENELLQDIAIEDITLTNGKLIFYQEVNVVPSKLPEAVFVDGEYDEAATLKNLRSNLYTSGALTLPGGKKLANSITTTLEEGAFKLGSDAHMLRMFMAPTRPGTAPANLGFRIDVEGGHFDVVKTTADKLTAVQEKNNAAIDKMYKLLSADGYTASNGGTYSFRNISTADGALNPAQRVTMALAIENFTADYIIEEDGDWDKCVKLANALKAENPTFTIADGYVVEFGTAETMNVPTGGVTVVAEEEGSAVLKIVGKTTWNKSITVGEGVSVVVGDKDNTDKVNDVAELSIVNDDESLTSVMLTNYANIKIDAKSTIGSQEGTQFVNNGCVTIEYGSYVYPAAESTGDIAYELTATDNVAVVNKLVAGGTNNKLANVNKLIVKNRAWDLDETIADNTEYGDRYDSDVTTPGTGYNFAKLADIAVVIENAQVSSAKKQATFATVSMSGAESSLTGVSVTGALTVKDQGVVDCVSLASVNSDGNVKANTISAGVTAVNIEANSIAGDVVATGNVTVKEGNIDGNVTVTGTADAQLKVDVKGNITKTVTATYANVTAAAITENVIATNADITAATIGGNVNVKSGVNSVSGANIAGNVTVEAGSVTLNNVNIAGTLQNKGTVTINNTTPANISVLDNHGTLTSNVDLYVTDVTLNKKSVTTLGAEFDKTVWYTGTYTFTQMTLNGTVKQFAAEQLIEDIDNAAAGATVTLKGDVELTEALEISKDVTLDLNGKTLTLVSTKILNSGNLTLKGGTISADVDEAITSNAGSLTMIDCNVTGVSTVVMVNGGNTTITGGSYNNNAAEGSAYCIGICGGKATINTTVNKDNVGNGGLTVQGAEVNITGGEYYGNPSLSQYGLHATKGAKVTYSENVKFNNCYIQVKSEVSGDELAATTVNDAVFRTATVTGYGFKGTKAELNAKIQELQ